MKNMVFLRVVLILGSVQWLTVTSLLFDDVSDPPPTIDTLDNSPVEIMPNIPMTVATEELYQGDMVLTDEQRRALVARKAMKDTRYRWPKSADGTVNIDYRFADTIVNKTIILLAMSRLEEATCVKFNEISAPVTKPHLIYITSTDQCSSSVGQVYSQNGQNVNLQPGCFTGGEGTVVHELGHALGLYHEQSRSDRDDYLYIMLNNVKTGMEHNFDKEDSNNYGLPYDYTSIMQYRPDAFTKNGLNTIVAKDPLAQPLIQDAQSLSFMDKKIVNLMYNCTDTWQAKCNLITSPCMNQGYTRSNCTCECPAGTSGVICETLSLPYIDALINAKSPGSQRITTAGTVTSPGFPTPVTTEAIRVQSIEAPACNTVKLTFNVFDMEGLANLTSNNWATSFQACFYMTLEIRLDDPPVTGTEYCGANITANQTFRSVGRFMVLTFKTKDPASNTKTGYSATVEFVPVTTGNCTPTTTTSATTSTTTSNTAPTTTSTTTPTTTSTTTPTTTPTTTSTTTSTTTPTTTSTTTPTITSTTTPTTTSTTTPTTTSRIISTTTAASSPDTLINSSISTGQCILVSSANSVYSYRSPNYPSNYCWFQQCTIWFNTTEPRYLKVTPLVLKLGFLDSVNLFYAYQTTTYLDAGKVGTAIILPTSSSRLTFQALLSFGGSFDIRVEVLNNACHQLIKLDVGSTGLLNIPVNYPPGTVCEWWLRAPAGRKVQVSFSSFSIGDSTCLRDFVVIDLTGDSRYATKSTRYCGGNAISPGTAVVSTGSALNILVNGQWGNYKGLNATYTVV